jgi:hypothetical protein
MRPGARVLLVNADDFGIYPAANAAVIDAIDHGIAASCSVMVLGPGAPEALPMLASRRPIWTGTASRTAAAWTSSTSRSCWPTRTASRSAPGSNRPDGNFVSGLPVVGHDFSWVRQTDHEFLVSGRAREVVEEEGITVVGWSRYSARR